MADFLDVLSPSALANLQKANTELTTMIRNVATLTGSMNGLTIPSNSDAEVRRLNADLLAQQQIIKDLQKQITSLANARQQNNTRTSEEIVNQRALAQNADRQTRATSALVGAYANLNAQHQIASTRLQNLIVRGRQATQTQSQYNRELRTAQRDFDVLNRRVLSADQAVGRFNRNVGNYPRQAVMGIKDLIGAFGVAGGVTLFATVVKDIFQTTKELQSLDNALKQVTETQENFIEQQQFLTRISEAYGAEIQGLTKQFTQFYVSAKDKISGAEIQAIFESITKAGASMGLSVESQERAFLALNQMMSKGTIQAEELRGQLGEALPGAFGIMAKAMGVTEKQLGQMMKDGKVLADEVLPKFAKQLEITYGIENVTRIDTLAASTNRFTNTWTEFVRNLNDSPTSGIGNFFNVIVTGATWALGKLTNLMSSLDELRGRAVKQGTISGTTSFNEQFKVDFKPLSDEEKKKIQDRVAEINKEILTATNQEQAKLRGEQQSLLSQLYSADPKKIKSTIAKVASDTYREYAIEYNALAKKTKELADKAGLKGDDLNFFIDRGVDPARKTELKELMAKELEVYRLATKNDDTTIKKKTKIVELTKAQLAELERLKRLEEERLKNVYERELSDLERKKDISQANFEDEKQYAEKRIQLSEDVALYENLIALRRFKENLRLHKDSLDLQKIDANNYQTEQENIVKRSEDRILKIRKDNFDAFTEYREKYGKPADEETFGTGVTFLPTEQLDELIQGYEKLNEEKKKSKKLTEDEKKAVEDYIATFKESFMNEAGFPTLFKVLNDEIAGFGDNWRTTFLAIGEIAKEAFEFISEASNANFENEYSNLEKQKNVALLFAGDSASAREEIERQYEERQRAIRRREFQAQKATALFNIAINTAQGIVSALASTPPNVPLSIAIGAIGAIQAGVVASRQIPEFWKGTDNAPEGFALTQERGREIITDKYGNIKSTGSDKGAQLTYLNKGDKVLTNDKTMDFLMFNSDLNNILSNNGIGSPIVNVQGNTTDLTPVVNAINNKEGFQLSIDENGFNKRIRNGHTSKVITNRRTSFKGYGV